MDKKERLIRQMAGFLEISRDLILDEPKLTVIAREEAALENHRGIIEYSPRRVGVGLARGYAEITGEELMIKALYPEEVRIVGLIRQIRFLD